MKEKRKISPNCVFLMAVLAGVLSTLIFLNDIVLSESFSSVPPPIYGIDIVEYNSSIVQVAGTTQMYKVKVKNTGIMDLENIRLGSDRLDKEWFYSNDTKDLKFGECDTLTYFLEVPKDVEDLYAFSLVVYGTHGINSISNTKLVALNIIKTQSRSTTDVAEKMDIHVNESGWTGEPQKNLGATFQKMNETEILIAVTVTLFIVLLILFALRKIIV